MGISGALFALGIHAGFEFLLNPNSKILNLEEIVKAHWPLKEIITLTPPSPESSSTSVKEKDVRYESFLHKISMDSYDHLLGENDENELDEELGENGSALDENIEEMERLEVASEDS